MNVIKNCPICGDRMKNDNYSVFVERLCQGTNHFIKFIVNRHSKKIECLKLSYDIYNRVIFIDLIHNRSKIFLFKEGIRQNMIDVPYALPIDFPHLSALKEKVNLFILYS